MASLPTIFALKLPCLDQDRILNIAEALHELLQVFLRRLVADVPHEERLGLRCGFNRLLLPLLSLLELASLLFSLLGLLRGLAGFSLFLDLLRHYYILSCLLRVLDDVLHTRLVAAFRY